MVRSVVAVIGGYAAMVVVVIVGTLLATRMLAGTDGSLTAGYLVANLAVSLAGAVLAGVVAMRLAPRRPEVHVWILAGLVVLAALPGILRPAPGQPVGYVWILPVLAVVGILLGGRLGRGGLSGASSS